MNLSKRRPFFLLVIVALILALMPVAVMAQEFAASDEGFLFRVNGPVAITENETIETVVVIGDNAFIDGVVSDTLVVINGDAIISGRVDQNITVVRGTLTLEPTARVDSVTLIRSDVVRAPEALVGGPITEGDFQINPWDWGIFWAFIWVGVTLVVLTSGVVFAAIGSRQLKAAGNAITRDIGPLFLAAIAAWFVMPILMFFVIFTVVGIPLGIGYFLFVMPVLWFLGYLVAGTQLGRVLLPAHLHQGHPYVAALLGLLILQVVGIVPILGGLIAFIAGFLGSGALLVLAWRAWTGPGTTVQHAETASHAVHAEGKLA